MLFKITIKCSLLPGYPPVEDPAHDPCGSYTYDIISDDLKSAIFTSLDIFYHSISMDNHRAYTLTINYEVDRGTEKEES